MAYNEALAQRIREIVYGVKGSSERKMFGGIAFLMEGRMCCGVVGERLMARIDPAGQEATLAKAHVAPMDFTGRPMSGFVFVEAEGVKTRRQLAYWVERSTEYARSLPPKGARKGSGGTPAKARPDFRKKPRRTF